MIVPRVFKSRQRKRKNISIVLSSQKVLKSMDFRTFFALLEGLLKISKKLCITRA